MITFTLVAPVNTVDPGLTTLQLLVSSDNPGDNFGTSISLLGNGIPVLVDKTLDEDTYLVSCPLLLLGGSKVLFEASAEDQDETKRLVWHIVVNPSAIIRGKDYMSAPYMDSLAFYLPQESRAVVRQESVFRQLMNPIALELDRIKLKLQSQNRSLMIDDVSDREPDWMFEYDIDESADLQLTIRADGSVAFAPPSSAGYIGINKLELTAVDNFDDFWTNAIPTRLSLYGTLQTRNITLTPTASIESFGEVSGFKVPTKDRLFGEVSNGEFLVDVNRSDLAETYMLITGVGRNNRLQTELLPVHQDGNIQTRWKWSSISSITPMRFSELTSADIQFSLLPPRLSEKKDDTFKWTENRRQELVRYAIEVDEVGSSLDQKVSAEGEVIDIASGQSTVQIKTRTRLTSVMGTNIFVTDFSLGHTNTFIYGVDSTKLYIWDKRNVAPTNLKLLSGMTEAPEQTFSIECYENPSLVEGEYSASLSVELERPQGLKPCRSWLWSVITPSGATKYINPLTGDILDNEQWTDGHAQGFGIVGAGFDLQLTELGDYLIELRIDHGDGDPSICRRIFQFREKKAIAEYDLSSLINLTDGINRIHVTESGEIWISHADIIYKLTPHFDLFIISAENRKIYFREDYDDVEVTF